MPFFDRIVRCRFVAFLLLAGGAPGLAQPVPDRPVEMVDIQKEGKPPRGIKQSPPIYPYGMSRAGLIGNVTLDFIITNEGTVANPVVAESNNPWFERPAIEAVLKWKFHPAELRGRAVHTRVRQRIEFHLESSGRPLWQISKTKNHKELPLEFQWDRPPVVLHSTFPVYPFEALRDKTKGSTKLSFVVGPDGRVHKATILEASTPQLGQAALAMIDGWRFKPAQKKDGTPGFALVGIEHEFSPQGRGDVPVSDEALDILRDLAKEPTAIVAQKDLDHPPKPVSRRPPVYPSVMEDAGQSGEAVIEFFIDKRGDAQLPRIVSSSAEAFGYAAAQAVATWRFEPPIKNGKPVIVRAQIQIGFSPRKPKPAEPK
jgi:TonB family protein